MPRVRDAGVAGSNPATPTINPHLFNVLSSYRIGAERAQRNSQSNAFFADFPDSLIARLNHGAAPRKPEAKIAGNVRIGA